MNSVKVSVRDLLRTAASSIGALEYLEKSFPSGRFHILAYHRIGPERSLDGLVITREIFLEQMRYLRQRCRPMRLGQLVEAMHRGDPIPPRAVAVTFDDGYADTYTAAFPILRRLRIPATVFITTGYVDRRLRLPSSAPPLSWSGVKAMHRAGIEIGSHTVTHPHLTQCSLVRVRRELVASRRRIEDQLNGPVTLFAYPFGDLSSFNRTIRDCVQEAGYQAACSYLLGHNGADTDPYALRRVNTVRNEIRHFAFQVFESARGRRLAKRV